nr:unnamed protein product [Callosobruchus analis]
MSYWDYWDRGPRTWADRFPAFHGKRQSPIDIPPNGTKEVFLKELEIQYKPMELRQTVENVGYSWKLCLEGSADNLQVWGGPLKAVFILDHIHCHWGDNHELGNGSEHAVGGKKYEGELHFSHINRKYGSLSKAMDHDDGVGVIAVFMRVGTKENPELAKILSGLKHCEFRGKSFHLEDKVDIVKLIPQNSYYFVYQGSLARPPCIECVVWMVFKDPIEISQSQLDALNELQNHRKKQEGVKISNNYRPLCPTNSREVLLVKVPRKGCQC